MGLSFPLYHNFCCHGSLPPFTSSKSHCSLPFSFIPLFLISWLFTTTHVIHMTWATTLFLYSTVFDATASCHHSRQTTPSQNHLHPAVSALVPQKLNMYVTRISRRETASGMKGNDNNSPSTWSRDSWPLE